MRWLKAVLLAVALLLLSGCGSSRDPVSTPPDPIQNPGAQTHHSQDFNRILWGFWTVRISADRQSIDVVPDRTGEFHLNVVRMLEVFPCTDCLRISNVNLISDDQLEALLTLKHPYENAIQYTGFDVRAIFISGADYTFPESGRGMAWGPDKSTMLDPDGFTVLFNPTEFPLADPPALGYIPGRMAPGGDLSATLNPYLAYAADEPRCMFGAGEIRERRVVIYLPPGDLEFGYAVDASWQPVDDVIDPLEDFPPEANCLEAYRISVSLGDSLQDISGSSVPVSVEVFDHQGFDTIQSVTIESPDLFSGEESLSFSNPTGDDSWLFEGELVNRLGAEKGVYPLLVRVRDTETDPNFGAIDAYQVAEATVKTGWAQTWGGSDSDSGNDITVDSYGNSFVVGRYYGVVDFDPGPGLDMRLAEGNYDNFLCKYSQSGLYQWALTWGSYAGDEAYGVKLDAEGNIYVTGLFSGMADFDPGDGIDFHYGVNRTDIYLSKFYPSGDFAWARTWGGNSTEDGRAVVAVDPDGMVYIFGRFGETVDFDPGPGIDEKTAMNEIDFYLSKLDTDGNYLWSRTWTGADEWTEAEQDYDMVLDSVGNIIIAGTYYNTGDFDPGPDIDEHTSIGMSDVFVNKLDPDGNLIWCRTWGGTNLEAGNGVAVDDGDNIYVTGYFGISVDFDPGFGTDFHDSNGIGDAFLTSLTSDGHYRWTRTWGSMMQDTGNDVLCFGPDRVLVTGAYRFHVDFDPGPDEEMRYSNSNSNDIFVSCFAPDGSFLWVSSWGGEGYDYGAALDTDLLGNIFVTGGFRELADFDPGTDEDWHESNGHFDAFVAKLSPDGSW